jgi:hypothetical protein
MTSVGGQQEKRLNTSLPLFWMRILGQKFGNQDLTNSIEKSTLSPFKNASDPMPFQVIKLKKL